MTQTVNINGLSDAIVAELTTYQENVTKALKREIKRAAREAVAEISATAPRSKGKDGGAYADDWRKRTDFENHEDIRVTIYNKDHYQLTHLLEHGHVIKNGTGRTYGETRKFPHVIPVEQKIAEKLADRIKVELK